MAANTQQLDRRAKAIEKDLYQRIDGGSGCAELAAVLQEYRTACEALIFSNFEHASAHDLQTTLWNAHLKVNATFRHEHKLLKRSKDHVVELRKFQKTYLHFIKASQRFYRQYILNLDAQFDGIPGLRKIALKWKDDTSKSSPRQRIPATLKTQVILSCHQTLIQLGDLSRYRETELVEKNKERNWGPAKGYYDSAADIYPDSGHAPNQLAVIAREDGDHFRCVYHLYRSLASKEPYPQAKANLATEFKRVIAAWDNGQLINNHKSAEGNTGRALIAWFIRLHSKLYKGEEFAAHDELEGEVLSHLAIELKERPLDSILTKIILINMSAEYFATVQLQSENPPPNIMRTYFYYLRLNVKTFFILLQVLQPELDRLSEGNDVKHQNGDRAIQLSDKITAVARRILPGLRLYSTWFARYWKILNANIADTLNTVDVQELWKAYAATLSLLASSFPVEQLPQEDYMLEEDVDTIGFEPLIHPDTMKVWYNGDAMKQKATDPGLQRNHPNVEMLMRVKDLLIDGLLLVQNPDAPLDLAGPRFIYQEEGVPSELLASPTNQPDGSPVLSVQAADMPLFQHAEATIPDDQKSYSVAAVSESASTTLAKDNAMRNMVDDLVGEEAGLDPLVEEDENIPPTPPEQTFDDTAVVNDTTFAPTVLSINELVNSVRNYKPLSPGPASALLSAPMGRTGSTSSIRQPPNLPSVPDGQWNSNSIWNRTPGPASPSMMNANGFGNDVRRSPMNGTKINMSGHVRGDSANSLLSADAVTPTTNRAPRPISGSFSGGLGSGAAWGNQGGSPSTWGSAAYSNSFVNNGHHHQGYAYGANMASPLLFSSYREGADSAWGRTPPNGQGG
ncbi:telomerase activating protein est1 protein [Stemphylium lycopersici]|nr:telomerase activating protein est1 protein [Stemphylium lycopersici]